MARVSGFGVSNSKIYLNVYDLNENNDIYYPWGLGFYHSGLQVGREEYTFGKSKFYRILNLRSLITLSFPPFSIICGYLSS